MEIIGYILRPQAGTFDGNNFWDWMPGEEARELVLYKSPEAAVAARDNLPHRQAKHLLVAKVELKNVEKGY